MTRLQFDLTEGAAVYDGAGSTTDWRQVGGSAHPIPRLGLRHGAQYFDGTVGYEGRDDQSTLMGLHALHIRALVRPDFEVLAGKTVTIIARGQGGPTVPEGWAYDLRLAVAANATSAVVQLAWTDELLSEVVYQLGIIARPAPASWTLLAVNRELVAGVAHMRLAVNGEPSAGVTATDQVPATPGAVMTLGCRRSGSEHERFFAGDIEFVTMDDVVTGESGERWFASQVLNVPDEALDAVREYWFEAPSVVRLRDSDYERYRLRPLAALVGESQAAIELREQTGLPNAAHGERLAAWETALGLDESDRLSLSERQVRAANALALVEGIGAETMRQYAAQVLGIESPDEVALIESSNDFRPDLSQTATETVDGVTRDYVRAWRTYGNITTVFDPSSGDLQIFAADATPAIPSTHKLPLPASNIEGAGFAEFAIEPDTQISLLAHTESADGVAAPMLRRGTVVQRFLIVAQSLLLSFRSDGVTGDAGEVLTNLLPESASHTWRFALRVLDSGDTEVRIRAAENDDNPDAFATFITSLSSLGGPAEWAGFHSVNAVTEPLFIRDLRVQYPTHPAKYWSAIADVARNSDLIAAQLARKNRATARAGYSQDRFARTDSNQTFVDYTPMIGDLR